MRKQTFTLAEIATLTGSQLVNGDPAITISGVAGLDEAGPADASFLCDPRYTPNIYTSAMRKSRAGVLFLSPKHESLAGNRPLLLHHDPSFAFQTLVNKLHGERKKTGFTGIHPTAVIHETAILGDNVSIGPFAVIDAKVSIGDRSTIGAHSYIGWGTSIGKECYLYPHVTVREECQLRDRVTIQPGAVIGSCGFGYTTDEKGTHTRLEQVGNVVIDSDVDIGANTTIDRARFKATKIGKGTKIDNLVQIAHGVITGYGCIIVSLSGIAGSTRLGNHVVLGAQTGVVGHVTIADQSQITARSGVSKSLTVPGEKYGGAPAMPLRDYNRNSVYLKGIEGFVKELTALKKTIGQKKS